MKKNMFCTLALAICILGCLGCEDSTKVRASFISESTSAGSDNYGVKITYAEDSRLEGKGVDTQIKFSKKGEITIWQEGENKINYVIEDYDEWYSMTMIFSQANGNSGHEKFERFDNVLAKSYFFNSQYSQEITLRTVVGDIDDNLERTGEILVGSEVISDQFTLKINKKS